MELRARRRRSGRRPARLLSTLVLLGTCACSELSPCDPLDLAGLPATREASSAVLALSRRELVTVIRSNPLSLEQITVRGSNGTPARPDQLLLTASSRWLTYRVGSDVFSVDLDHPEHPRIGFSNIDEIVGTLRSGDWLIYRSWGIDAETDTVQASSLEAIYVGDPNELPKDHPSRFVLGAGRDLRVVTMGHRHLVAREIHSAGHEELYLIPIAPTLDGQGAEQVGLALPLVRGDSFTRVVMTEGPSPAALGSRDEFQRHVPSDAQLIVTSGEWPDARTLIYDAASREEVANFDGAVVTAHVAREHIPGLEPVSPDGTQLAYIARSGALALRDLETHESCSVRAGVGRTHELAGFGSDGTLYFESSERDFDKAPGSNDSPVSTHTHVYAHDTWTRRSERLTRRISGDSLWTLLAVPAGPSPTGEKWALVTNNQPYIARPESAPTPIEAGGETAFIPRNPAHDPDGLGGQFWMIESSADQLESSLSISKLGVEGRLGEDLLQGELSSTTSVCMSTSQSANLTSPWATRCAFAEDAEGFLYNGTPETEKSL